MGYIKDELLPILKHSDKAAFLSEDVLKECLWYTTSNQSYIQRTTELDSSCLSASTSDEYISLLLMDLFAIDSIHIFSSWEGCNSAVDSLLMDDIDKSFIYIAKDKSSLYLNVWEKVRNALAHGGFNLLNDSYYLLGQGQAKPGALVNFLLQSKIAINISLGAMAELMTLAMNDMVAFKYRCIEKALNISVIDGKHYSHRVGRYVIINDDFRFQSNKHVDEVKKLSEAYDFDQATDVIVSENLGNISAANLTSKNGRVRVVAQSKLIEYYGLTGVEIHQSEASK